MKVISTFNEKIEFSMFCDLCVTRMVRFRLKSFSCSIYFWQLNYLITLKLRVESGNVYSVVIRVSDRMVSAGSSR